MHRLATFPARCAASRALTAGWRLFQGGGQTSLPPSPLLQAALSGDPQSQFDYALHLGSEAAGAAAEPSPRPVADSPTEVLAEVKVVQTKAKKRKRAALKQKKMGALNPVVVEDGSAELTDSAYWLRLAYEGGHVSAAVALANKLFNDGGRKNVAEAMELYEEAAEEGHPDACFNLGNAYYQGTPDSGLVVDLQKSLHYFKRGADAGDASCLYWLGHCYASGEGGVEAVNTDVALRHLSAAATLKHPAALYYLAMLHRNAPGGSEENLALFRDHLEQAFEAGDADAAFCLAEVYMTGTDGFPVDLLRSRQMLVEATDRGHAEAAASLGAIYYAGSMGVPQDREKAFQLYNLAAERGCNDAWMNVAAMYATGEGVEKSEESAKYIMKVVFGDKKRS